jgi:endonuclease/exonuclease/phosphatase (EEP) superfamily protein YafD
VALGADVLLLVLFGIGYAARHLPPTYAWWAELIATALPYVTIVLVGATVVVLFARRWRLLAVHGCVLVLAVLRFAPSALLGAASEGTGDTLTVLTFNTSRGGGISAEAQGQALTDVLRTTAPDVACFQDLNLDYEAITTPPDGPVTRLAVPPDSLGYTVIGPETPEEAVRAWQPVLVRVPVVAHEQRLLRDADGRQPSRVVRVHFRWEGREAVLYNLHLRTFGAGKPWADAQRDPFTWAFWTHYLRQYRDAYLARAREVQQVEQMLAEETLPVLLCGDFNSTPHNWAYQRLARGRQDVFREVGRGWGATYHARLPFARIDHVIADPAWLPLGARAHAASLSDHRSLLVRLRWRGDS